MACSKLFSGDLPEISTYIIQNLRNNFSTLYSLVLVNRFWCRLAIPLLWEDPFSIKYRETLSFHFLDIYFLFFNDSDKRKLREIKFKFLNDSNLKKPLFNYPSLIKTLNSFRIVLHVTNWISASYNVASTSVQRSPLTSTESYEKRSAVINKEKTNVVCIALFKLFIENNASLYNLDMFVDYIYQSTYAICDMVLNNPKFISEIFCLKFCDYSLSSLYYKSLEAFLSSFPSSIKQICYYSNNVEVKKNFTN